MSDTGNIDFRPHFPVFGPASIPFWGDYPDRWDKLKLAGVEVPGIVKITGKRVRRNDKKQTAGSDGVDQTHLGYEPMEFDIAVILWESDQWIRFQQLVPKLLPKPNSGNPKTGLGEPRPVSASHPTFALYNVGEIYIAEMGLPTEGGNARMRTVNIRATEFNPIKKKGGIYKADASRVGVDKFPTVSLEPKTVTPPSVANADPGFSLFGRPPGFRFFDL